MVIKKIGSLITDEYIFPDVAQKCVALLDKKLSGGGYNTFLHPRDFADEIVNDLRSISKDKHFRLSVLFGVDENEKQQPDPEAELIDKIKKNTILRRIK